ncbi:MAG TPA: hypothetical protein VMU17_06390 [Elusimicrobiota bacterium]|nr:hypothetical protein [Elusimicrobiota bacterium]
MGFNRRIATPCLLVSHLRGRSCGEDPITPLLKDGLYVYSAPLRARADDLPLILGSLGILGAGISLDRITYRNLTPESNSSSAGAVGFSRLDANQPWASDVIGGSLLGSGIAYGLFKRHARGENGWRLSLQPSGLAVCRAF